MSRARHKRAKGGGMHEPYGKVKPVVEAGKGTANLKEAEERRHGGHVEGSEHKKHKGRKHGGNVMHEVKHHSMKHTRPGRKRGGGIGANLVPLSTAARIKEVTKGEYGEDAEKSD